MYTKDADLWSFGCLLFQMATSKCPFSHPTNRNLKQLYIRILEGQINEFPAKMSKNLKDLILKLLQVNPRKRLGSKDFKDLISHPFFENCFTEDGKINKNNLKKEKFQIKLNNNYDDLKPIPIQYFIKLISKNSGNQNNDLFQGFINQQRY
jgi:serine/threonine protein kinase